MHLLKIYCCRLIVFWGLAGFQIFRQQSRRRIQSQCPVVFCTIAVRRSLLYIDDHAFPLFPSSKQTGSIEPLHGLLHKINPHFPLSLI